MEAREAEEEAPRIGLRLVVSFTPSPSKEASLRLLGRFVFFFFFDFLLLDDFGEAEAGVAEDEEEVIAPFDFFFIPDVAVSILKKSISKSLLW